MLDRYHPIINPPIIKNALLLLKRNFFQLINWIRKISQPEQGIMNKKKHSEPLTANWTIVNRVIYQNLSISSKPDEISNLKLYCLKQFRINKHRNSLREQPSYQSRNRFPKWAVETKIKRWKLCSRQRSILENLKTNAK